MKPARIVSLFLTFISLPSASFSQTKNFNAPTTLAAAFPLTTHPEADLMPALSFEGKWLAYVSRQNGNYDIWARPTAGGLPNLLTSNTSDDFSPSWSPDNKALVFVSRRDDAEGDLYLLQLETREDGFAPGKLKRLTNNLAREAFPQFSPDGKKVAYSFGAKGEEQVWLYEIKTGAHFQLTTRGGTQPAWSPNGNELAIACRGGETNEQQIFIISADTTQADYLRRQVTFEGDNHFPSWSREGKSILVQRKESAANARAARLFLVPVELAATNLAQLASGLQITPDSEGALFPCWSHDGFIYYAAELYGNLDIWRIPATGAIPRFTSPAEAFAHAQKIVDHETAVLAFSALRYHFPDSAYWLARAGVEMGRRYVQMNDLAQARKSWNNVVLYYIGANEGAGLAELELAKLDANVERLNLLRARYQAWPNVQALCLLEQGRALTQQRQYDLALKTFQSITQQFPSLREVCYRAALHEADLLLLLERSEAAEARYAEIIAEYREPAEWREAAIARLLEVAPTLARTADTLAAYQRVLQRHAALPEIVYRARFRIAARLQREGEAQLAENEWRNVIDGLAAFDDPALRALRAQALRHLLQLQIARNDLPVAELLYAQLEKEHGRANEAAHVQAARFELTQALVRRGRALIAARDFQLARAAFSQARRYQTSEVEAHRGYIETMNALDQIDEALAEYTRLSAQNPRDEIALYALGLAYSYKGAGDAKTLRRSSVLIEAALALNYRLVPAYLTLGFNYEGIEKLEQQERDRKKGFFEKIAFALPGFLDNLRRTLTFRPPKPAARWYERALEALTTAIALNDETTHPQREAQLALNLANSYYNLGEFAAQNAFRYYQIKQRYDSTFVSSQQRAVVLERMGETGWASGKYQEAAPLLREAVNEYRLLRDAEGELRSLLRLALLYQTSGDYNTSNEYFRDFITASRRENREANLAQTWRTIARNHQLLAENDDAITRSLRALDLLETGDRDNFPQPKKSRLTIKLFGLPIFWQTIAPTGEEASAERLTFEQERELVFSIIEESHATRKDFDAALIELEKKLASFRKRKDRKGEALALNHLGSLHYNLHDFAHAHAHYLGSFQICTQNNFAAGAMINLLNLGNLALLRTRVGDENIPTTLAALDSLLSLAQPLLEQATERQQLAVCTLRGNLAYEKAAALWPEAASKNGEALHDLQNELQRSLQALQHFARARRAYEQALALARTQRLPREEIIVRRNLASLFMLARDYSPAWAHLRLAHERSVENNFTQLTWRLEHGLGALTQLAPEHGFSNNSALDWYRHALDLLEALPEEPEGVEQRLAESEEQNALYESAIKLLAEKGESDKQFQREALELAERKHARHFINLIASRYILPRTESQRLIWGGGGGEFAFVSAQLNQLRAELIKLQAEEPVRPKELARVRSALQQAEAEYQAVVDEALAENPELASFFSVQSLALESVRDSLAAGAAVLKYFVAEKELVIWLITREHFEQTRMPYERARLQQEIATLREAWRANTTAQSAHTQNLSALLLAPLRQLEDCAQLIIVPDDALHYLPFAALPFEEEALAERFTLTRVASLQALQFAARHKNLNAEQLLLVQDAGASAPRFVAALSNLKTQTLTGVDWRVNDALHPQVQSAGLLHVQSRLVLQPERPLDSGFVLRFMKSESLMTARLPLYRLFENELRASVLVLENTALPYRAGQTGEELIALQRSLFYSGVPSLVMSQWEVAPEVRNTFYAQFYAGLSQHSLAAAMREARLATRAQHPNTNDWAAFELIGYAGMNEAEKSAFAQRYLFESIASGTSAENLGEFDDAVRYNRAALSMAKQLGQTETIQRLYLKIRAAAVAGNDFATACEIETVLLAEAQAANDLRRVMQSYLNLSIWRLRLQDYRAAEEAERQFLSLAERNNNALALSGSHFRLAQIFQAANDYEPARAAATQAAQILAAQNQALPRLQVETFLGKLALEADDAPQALADLEAALAAFQAARGENALTVTERRALATAQQLLGRAYGNLTSYRTALTLHRQALEVFSDLADTANIARAEQFVAETFWLNAEYQSALQHQQRALALIPLLPDKPLRIRAQTSLGLIKLSLGELEAALDAQKRALQIALEWEEERETEAQREQATVQKNLGLTYLQLQQHAQALASFQVAAKLDAKLAAERGLLYDHLNLGNIFALRHEPDSALFHLARAETLAVRVQDQRALAKAFFFKGQTLLQMNQRVQAQAAFAQALERAEQFRVEELAWRCLWQLGVLAKQESELERARDFYARAISGLESLSAKIKIAEYRSGFIDDKAELYEEAVLLLLQMKREPEAFMIIERAKSRSFADMLGNSGVDWQATQSADRTLLEKRERLLEEINFTQGKLAALQSQTRGVASAQAENDTLAALQRAYSELLVEMKAANPELADAVSVEPLPLADLQTMLADSVALVEYFFAKDRLVCYVIDRGQARSMSTPFDRSRLGESIAQFRRAIEKRASTEIFSRALYDVLLKPVEPLLVHAKQLVIVPHGALHYVPFPALQRADSTYLIDRHALALAPSATVLGFCYRKAEALSRANADNPRVLALGNPDVGNARLDLPFAEKEIKSLEQTFEQTKSFTRKQATRSALLQSKDEAELLHFSCHGVYDATNPLFSALLLAPENEQSNGRLAAHEILGMKLNAQLVMLSACETGLARVTGGDEVIGLARSFIFAGAPSLVASLWTVDDLATAITVKRFYRYLKAGYSKAEALRAAQRFVREHHNRHPAYWASLGLTGAWQ